MSDQEAGSTYPAPTIVCWVHNVDKPGALAKKLEEEKLPGTLKLASRKEDFVRYLEEAEGALDIVMNGSGSGYVGPGFTGQLEGAETLAQESRKVARSVVVIQSGFRKAETVTKKAKPATCGI